MQLSNNYIEWKGNEMKRQVIVVRHMRDKDPQVTFTMTAPVELSESITDRFLLEKSVAAIEEFQEKFPEFRSNAQFYTFIIDQPQ